MKKVLFLYILSLALKVNASGKVTICHVPQGNTANPQTISISQSALRAHLDSNGELHGGDYYGECNSLNVKQFYPCNFGLRQKNISDNPTRTTHDYGTYSYINNDATYGVNEVIEAGISTFTTPWSMETSFKKNLTQLTFNFSSELTGSEHFVDFCMDGRKYHKGRQDFEIKSIQAVMNDPQDFDVRNELFCDLTRSNESIPFLSKVNYYNRFPIYFKHIPKYCVVRIHLKEYLDGSTRHHPRRHHNIIGIIESNIDEMRIRNNP